MLTRFAIWVTRHWRPVLIASGVLLVAMAALATTAFGVLKNGGFDDPASDSSSAVAVLDREFGGQADLVLLITPKDGFTLGSPQVTELTAGLTRDLAARGDVTLMGAAAGSGLITMHVDGDETASAGAADEIIAGLAKDGPVAEVRAGGQLGVGADIATGIGTSIVVAEAIAVPLTLLLLFLVFGSLLAATLPLVIGVLAIAGTFAELAVLGRLTDVSVYSINLTTALGLGLAIDYSLLMVSRFREELQAGADVETAVATTVRTAGRTIIFSSATVTAALAALLLFPVYFLRSFAYAGIGVVVIAMLASLITMPALLAALGQRLRSRRRTPVESPFWRRVATGVMRRPLAVAVGVTALLLAAGIPVLHISFGTPDDRVLHTSAASRQVGDILRSTSGPVAPIAVVIQGTPSTTLDGYAGSVAKLPNVTAVAAPRTTTTTTLLNVTGPADANSADSQRLVRDLRALRPPAGTTVLVGGSSATLVDSKTAIGDTLPWALLWIALTTFLLLFLFTGSVVLPIKALLLNVLSLSAVFGVLVWIFQDGHLSDLLAFTPTPLNTAMLVLMFCIAFGLSMDYEVFLLARIKEAHDQGAGTVEAVATGLARTGRIVTTAAALLAITFFALAPARISFLQLFGIGTGIAVVIDATVIRGLLVPAFMRLAGQVNWWAPRPLQALHRRVGLTEAEPVPVS